MFKQEKKHIAEFMIEFKVLAIKADTNKLYAIVTNFIQLVSLQLVSQFSQTQLCWKASNESYLHIYGMYKSDNK